ncbi:MAG: helix-turn-helix transcriptional regulator [Candidatus Dormibacteria bacterium]
MTGPDETSVEAHRALAGWTRVALLACLREADGPLDARELATAVGLHASTVRFHLGVLAEAGLAVAEFEHRPRRGRPRQVWRSVAALAVGPEGAYRMLAEVLAGYLESSSGEPRALGDEIGRGWGSRLARARGNQQRPGVAGLVSMLGDLGFSPEVVETKSETEIRLHSCPFLAVAAENPQLVCSAHLGLLRGALAETGVPMVATELEPLVEPSLCIAHLQPVGAPDSR